MKKIICLLLALVAVFALAACGTEPCEIHADTDGNLVCDVCESEVDGGYAIFAMVAASEPTQVTTIEEVSIDGAPFTSIYTTTIYADGSFTHRAETQRPATLADEDEDGVVESTKVVEYKNGVYTVDGESVVEAPVINQLGVKREINAKNVKSYTVDKNGKTLTAMLDKAACEAIFGISVSADSVSLTVTTNGVRLSQITVSYTDANGSIITTQTSYSYTPVAAE